MKIKLDENLPARLADILSAREPGALALAAAMTTVAGDIAGWQGCFVVVTENKVRVKRP